MSPVVFDDHLAGFFRPAWGGMMGMGAGDGSAPSVQARRRRVLLGCLPSGGGDRRTPIVPRHEREPDRAVRLSSSGGRPRRMALGMELRWLDPSAGMTRPRPRPSA